MGRNYCSFRIMEFLFAVLVFAFCLTGCQPDQQRQIEMPRTLVNQSAAPDIRGEITGISEMNGRINAFEVEGPLSTDTLYDRASVRITESTQIYMLTGDEYILVSSSQLVTGQQVAVLFRGMILERYPVSAEAAEIIILQLAEPTPAPIPR